MAKKVKIGLFQVKTREGNTFVYSLKIVDEYHSAYRVEYGELLQKPSNGSWILRNNLPLIIKKDSKDLYDIKEIEISWWQNLTNNYF